MGRIWELCAVAAMGIMVAAGTCCAQKKKDTQSSPPTDPDVATINACLAKGSDGAFRLIKAQRESGATFSGDTLAVNISPLAADALDLNDRVGQRVEAVGRIVSADADSKEAGKGGPTELQLRSVRPVEGKPCS